MADHFSRKLTAILYANVAGYSRLTGRTLLCPTAGPALDSF